MCIRDSARTAPHLCSYLFAGGVLGWFVLMPLIVLFGQNVTLFPAEVSVAELYAADGGSFAIWSNYIKYIGAGAVAAGGVISLIKSLPLIVRTFRDAMKGYGLSLIHIYHRSDRLCLDR